MNAATGTVRRLALVAVCLGLLVLSTAQQAGALVHGGSPGQAADAQVAACQAMGGTATVVVEERTAQGDAYVQVICTGGMAGGWYCDNLDNLTVCDASSAPLPSSGDHDATLLTGGGMLADFGEPVPSATTNIGAYVEKLTQQELADAPGVVAPDDDRDRDANKGKGKGKDKGGKKHGKGGRK